MFPSVFIFCDFALQRMAEVIQNLHIDSGKMQANMELGQGTIYSSTLLTALVEKGMPRGEAYPLIQKESFLTFQTGVHLKERVLRNQQIMKYLNPDDVQKIFSFQDKRKQIRDRVKKILIVFEMIFIRRIQSGLDKRTVFTQRKG